MPLGGHGHAVTGEVDRAATEREERHKGNTGFLTSPQELGVVAFPSVEMALHGRDGRDCPGLRELVGVDVAEAVVCCSPPSGVCAGPTLVATTMSVG